MDNTILPDFETLFGEVEFKEGDAARSVYSPAAYLADLLQLMDDEFTTTDDFYERRGDIKKILLDSENTYEIIPYLDIVNEVLESKVEAGKQTLSQTLTAGDDRIKELYAHFINDQHPFDSVKQLLTAINGNSAALRDLQMMSNDELEDLFTPHEGAFIRKVLNAVVSVAVYEELRTQTSPINLPFSLHHERLMNHLNHLDITPEKLQGLFALKEDINTIARESLSMSIEDFDIIIKNDRTAQEVADYFNFDGTTSEFIQHMSKVSVFMETMHMEGPELVSLLFGNQYVDESYTEEGRANFFINNKEGQADSYAAFDPEEEYIIWGVEGVPSTTWIDATTRFLKLSRATGIDTLNLDLILRQCGRRDSNNVIELGTADIRNTAIIKHLKEKFDVEYDEVVTQLSDLSRQGFGNDEMPKDYFNRAYNNKCATVDGKYLKCDDADTVAPQFIENEYREIAYTDDLFSEANFEFRQRLEFVLGWSDEDLRGLTNLLEKREVSNILWMKAENKCDLLNFLYRLHQLVGWLETTYSDLFIMFDLIERDPSITEFDQQNTFLNIIPSQHNCYITFKSGSVDDRAWLVQTLCALFDWMNKSGFTAELLWNIANGEIEDEERAEEVEQTKIEMLNSVYQAFKPYGLTADSFVNSIFNERLAHIIYRTLKKSCGEKEMKHDARLVDYKADEVMRFAQKAVDRFDLITVHDFENLNIEEKLTNKLFQNLVYRGYINTSGKIMGGGLPETASEFYLETDFSDYLEPLFNLIHELYLEQEEEGVEEIELELFISDLEVLDLSRANTREVYDNLIFNNYISEAGNVQFVEFFSDTENVADFDINTHIGEHSVEIYEQIKMQLSKLKASRLPISSSAFSALELSEDHLAELIENLKFNCYIDEDMAVSDFDKLDKVDADTMGLSMQFYQKRHEIYKALKTAIDEHRVSMLTIDRAKLSEIADGVVAEWAFDDLQEEYLDGGQVAEDRVEFFKDVANKPNFILSYYFDGVNGEAVFNRVAEIIETSSKYHFSTAALESLNFDLDELDELIEGLLELNAIDQNWKIPTEQVEYFLNADNALTFNVDGFEDYAKDIFFILHEVAKAVKAGWDSIDETLKTLATDQEQFVFNQMQNVLGIEADIVESMSKAIFMRNDMLAMTWLSPLFDTANELDHITKMPENQHFNVAFQRMIQFALLAKKLQLTSREVDIAFNDQDLVMKFPERLELPDGVEHIDAILEDDEYVYLFVDDKFWIYRAEDYMIIYPSDQAFTKEQLELYKEDEKLREKLEENTIKELFEKENITEVDAAFKDREGNRYIVSGGYYYLQINGSEIWDKRKNAFGETDNVFANLHEIDAAFKDKEGRLFLFSKDHYVRYSDDYEYVDQGYPKSIADDWPKENLDIDFPSSFKSDLDAAFEGTDGYSYFFKGDQFISSEDSSKIIDITEQWGHTKYDFSDIDQIDAAYDVDGEVYLFSGDNVIKYEDCIENDDLQVADGFPAKIMDQFDFLPDEFNKGIDASFKGADGNLYHFKDDQVVKVGPENSIEMSNTDEVWGRVRNNLAIGGKVDAALVGLDGKTYIFSGHQYWRYSTEDYTKADPGFPARISEDWHDIVTVDAAFVLDGKTYLFGHDCNDDAVYVRYSTKDYEKPDEIDEDERKAIIQPDQPDIDDIRMLPGRADDKWWSLPQSLIDEGFTVEAILNSPDGKTYLFSEDKVIEFEHTSRWWSEPELLHEKWGNLPDDFEKIDAALGGKDGKIYLFYGDKYIRFSDAEFCKIDNSYPRKIGRYWGCIENNIERTCKVDAAVVVESRETEFNDKTGLEEEEINTHTYLFSGDQFYRYLGEDYSYMELGYPKKIVPDLKKEPRFEHLEYNFENGIDAAFADHRNVYLFEGEKCHVVSDEDHHKYTKGTGYNYEKITLASMYDGGILTIDNGKWKHQSSMEDIPAVTRDITPRFLNGVPTEYRSGLSAVLQGTNNNTYLFKGNNYYDHQLKRTFAISDSWGKVRNNIYDDQTIDTAFSGRDGKTYVFSGDQYFTYEGSNLIGQSTTEPPEPVNSKWGGLNSVALAYIMDGVTYLFEHQDDYGNFRYVQYTGDDYHRPDAGYPKTTNTSFWDIPASHQQDGFDHIDTIFVDDDNMIFISDQHFIRYNTKANTWTYPEDLEMLYSGIPFNKTTFQYIKTGFVAHDGTTYFFDDECYVSYNAGRNSSFSEIKTIRHDWGIVDNKVSDKVDATFIDKAGRTYLFSGDEFVRYSTNDYRHVDLGYPKPIADCLRKEEAFKHITKELQNELDAAESAGAEVIIEGVVENLRNFYVFLQGSMYAVSRKNYHQHYTNDLGTVKNNLLQTGTIDAAYVDYMDRTYLFSGDQYVRYSGRNYKYIDEGYPKLIAENLAAELGYASLPSDFDCGFDAVVSAADNDRIFFKDEKYFIANTLGNNSGNIPNERIIGDNWGQVKNVFMNGEDLQTIDGAYIDDQGHLYVYKGDQYARYSDPEDLFDLCEGCNYEEDVPKFVDAGYPMLIEDHCPAPPKELYNDGGLHGAFRFQGKTYFSNGNEFVGFADGNKSCQNHLKAREFETRWGEWSDYLLGDICIISRFKALEQSSMSDDYTLTDFLHADSADVHEPFVALANMFGFKKEDVRWVQRRNSFLAPVNQFEMEFGIETVLRIYDILSETTRISVDVKKLHEVWEHLYGTSPNLERAANGVFSLLATVDCNGNYETLFDQIHSELNVLKRDALVPYVISLDDEIDNTRQLFQKLLIDIEMESCADTSKIVEATAAVQLYLHRYFVNLEDVDLKGKSDEEVKTVLKEQWKWMRNYRVWEANRKVFLYPENYIRPELRDTKTPNFEELEEGLLQGEITEDAVERVYTKYLDQYTEVSELKLAGGYVFDEPGSKGTDKRLVLFGRTKVAPIRYFYRFGTFLNGESSSALWEPWLQVNISIESERVYPVFAFNRVFVFWSNVEQIIAEPGDTEVTVIKEGDTQTASSGTNVTYRIKIFYSFYNLNKEWVQPQELQTEFNGVNDLASSHRLSHVRLFVEESSKLGDGALHDNIVVNCQFHKAGTGTVVQGYSLTPELYSRKYDNAATNGNRGREMFEVLFDEGAIEEDNVVQLNSVENSLDGPWFSYDHKGGGFLCKPDVAALSSDAWPEGLGGNTDSLYPNKIDAAAHAGGKSYFFTGTKYVEGATGSLQPINSRWGLLQNNLADTGIVDAAYEDGARITLFSGDQYYRYTSVSGTSATLENGFPKLIDGNSEGIPWTKVDAAVKLPNNEVWYFNNADGLEHKAGGTIKSIGTRWGNLDPNESGRLEFADAGFVWDDKLYIMNDDRVLKYTDQGLTVLAEGYPKSAHLRAIIDEIAPGVFADDVFLEGYELKALYSFDTNKVAMRLEYNNGTEANYQFYDGQFYSPTDAFIDASGSNWTAGIAYTKPSSTGGHDIKIGFYQGGQGNAYRATVYQNGTHQNINRLSGNGTSKTPQISRKIDAAFPGIKGDTNLYFVSGGEFITVANNKSLNQVIQAIRDWSGAQVLGDKFNWNLQNNVLDNKQVDSAIVVGTDLYLTSGDQYLRYTYISNGTYSNYADPGYPKKLSTNGEGLPKWTRLDAAFENADGKKYFFKDSTKKFYIDGATSGHSSANYFGDLLPSNKIKDQNRVDAAFTSGDKLFLIREEQYIRYTIDSNGVPRDMDAGSTNGLGSNLTHVDAAFELTTPLGTFIYLFSGMNYYTLTGPEPDQLSDAKPIKGNWGNIPADLREKMDAAMNVGNKLFFFRDTSYIGYITDDDKKPKPYEIDNAPYEVIRLTSSTAEQLNQVLFAGGVHRLLQLSTQQIDERPSFSTNASAPTNIKVTQRIADPPVNSHIDFNSANGIYYWEVFFHAPFLIAQSLNTDQKFEEAKEWYEHIYDPTEVADYWKFLPFLAVDPEAMLQNARENLEAYKALIEQANNSSANGLANNAMAKLAALGTKLEPFDPVFTGHSSLESVEAEVGLKLEDIDTWSQYVDYKNAVNALTNPISDPKDKAAANELKQELSEVVDIIAKLHYRYDLMDNKEAQIETYLNDPFDPHAIASLRRIAYRKAIVMSYIDNLLDWGDMLFRQYTRESITEARMFYILAYDLLGERPPSLGRRILSDARSYDELYHYDGTSQESYEFLIDLENSVDLANPEEGLTFAGTVHDTIANPYFYIKENGLFIDYWNRVEDRLFKIRHCQNIMGIEVPLALFQPPIDPMALVNAVAGGGGLGAAIAGLSSPIPHYRFNFMLNKARELTNKLNQFGGDLLAAIEKKDAEALSILQNNQEATILGLTTQVKEKQIEDAETNIQMLEESKRGAENQKAHYERLIKDGLLSEEATQIALMTAAASVYGIVVLSKIVSGLAYVVPQFTVGAFSFGATSGGKNVGDMLSKFGEGTDSLAEGLSIAGEAVGIYAQYKRSAQDWELQKAMATSEIAQLEHQIEGARIQKAIAQRELQIHEAEIENNRAVATFMKEKFSNEQLYNWMSGKLSGLFYQTYKMAHDMSKQAEKAFQFETGTPAAEINFINGMYWDSQRKGLLSGESLGLDLDKMEKAFIEQDVRGFEITKNISLVEHDPLAFLQLKTKGVCEIRLSEAMFDYDFPGHYNRQMKSIAIAFDIGEGQFVNATLTQLNHKLVMKPDAKAVKYLLNPNGEMPDSIRVDWKVNQQIALSHVDEFTENSGLFELRFDTEKYLPFEGTGAVSLWRLELNGKKGSYNPAELLDATIKLRYTADQGGGGFANTVRGLLKPYDATAFFDLAYSFAEDWNSFQLGDENEMELTFDRTMFPNMSSSKIMAIMVRYELEDGKSASLIMDEDIQLGNNKYTQVSNISIGKDGSTFSFSAKGDKTAIKNVEMVMVYKATA